MAKLPAETAKRINDVVSTYMEMLKIKGAPPSLKLFNKPNEPWLARVDLLVPEPDDKEVESDVPVLEIQKKTLKADDKLLDRVIAHEMVHVRDYNTLIEDFPTLTRDERESRLADLEKHGPLFHEGAARVNAVMGPDYVMEVAFKEGEEIPEVLRYDQRTSFGPNLLLALGVGGLGFLGVVLWRRRRRALETAPRGSVRSEGFPRSRPRENERGSYGK